MPRLPPRRLLAQPCARQPSYAPSNDNEVAFNLIQRRHFGQHTPALKTEFLEQHQAGQVVAEDEPQQRIELERGCVSQCFSEEVRAEALLSVRLVNVDADLRGLVISWAPVERRETQPSRNVPVQLGHPQGTKIRRMLVEPANPAFHGHRL